MLSEQRSILILVVYGVMHIQVISCCSCPWRSFENSFCGSDYVIKARVLSETQLHGQETEGESTTTGSLIDRYNQYVEYVYEIQIENVYRSTPWYETAEKKVVITGILGCSMRIQTGTTYILVGFINYNGSDGSPSLGVYCDGAWSGEYFENYLENNLPNCNENQGRTRKNTRDAASFLRKAFRT